MKVLLVNGSPHKHGCTYTALSEVAKPLAEAGIETEFFQLPNQPVRGCIACGKCSQMQTGHCTFDDEANQLSDAIAQADGVVVGSPVYFAGPNGSLCALLDRVFFSGMYRPAEHSFAGKPAAAVLSCRRAGSVAAMDRLNKYFTYHSMPVVPSQYWNMVHGNTPKEVAQDLEGLQIMRRLGSNLAWMLQTLPTQPVPVPEAEKMRTNFIR